MSSPSDPVEIASTCIASFDPSFIAEPLPKARSICASAASRAFCLSIFPALSDSTIFSCAAIEGLPERNARGVQTGTAYRVCSKRTRVELLVAQERVEGVLDPVEGVRLGEHRDARELLGHAVAASAG